MRDNLTPKQRREVQTQRHKWVQGWITILDEQTKRKTEKRIAQQNTQQNATGLPQDEGQGIIVSLVDFLFSLFRPAPSPSHTAEPIKVQETDGTVEWIRRIPHWVLGLCTIIGGLIGFGLGASEGAATAALYAFVGAVAGLLAIPAAIKSLKVAAVAAMVAFVIWALLHLGK